MHSIPFSISVYEGLGEAEGLIRFDAESLKLEFEVKDSIVGILKSDLKEICIPLGDLESRKGWLSTSLVIQTSSLRTTRRIPGSDQGRMTLAIARRHRADAAKMLSHMLDHQEKWSRVSSWIGDHLSAAERLLRCIST